VGKNTQPGVKLCRPSPLGFWSTSTRSVVGDRYQTPPHRGEITTASHQRAVHLGDALPADHIMVYAHGRIGTSSAPAHHATTKPLGTATNPTNIASSTRTATGLRSRQRPQSSNPPPLSEWEGENVLQTTVRIRRFGLRHRHKASRLSTAECDLSQSESQRLGGHVGSVLQLVEIYENLGSGVF